MDTITFLIFSKLFFEHTYIICLRCIATLRSLSMPYMNLFYLSSTQMRFAYKSVFLVIAFISCVSRGIIRTEMCSYPHCVRAIFCSFRAIMGIFIFFDIIVFVETIAQRKQKHLHAPIRIVMICDCLARKTKKWNFFLLLPKREWARIFHSRWGTYLITLA